MPGSLGDKLKELRGRMSLREASQKTGLSHTYISQLENGKDPRSGKEIVPSLTVLEQIANGYGIPREELLIIVGYLQPELENGSSSDKSPIDNAYKLSDNSTYRDKVGQVNGLGADNLIPIGVVSVPVVASISCGDPSYTEDAIIGYVPMMADFIHGNPSEYVYLRASGDSMIGADIKDGSFVLIHRQNTADNGDIVAVCVENESATLKRYLFDGMTVILTAENPKYPPLTYLPHEIRIVGRAMMVTKTL